MKKLVVFLIVISPLFAQREVWESARLTPSVISNITFTADTALSNQANAKTDALSNMVQMSNSNFTALSNLVFTNAAKEALHYTNNSNAIIAATNGLSSSDASLSNYIIDKLAGVSNRVTNYLPYWRDVSSKTTVSNATLSSLYYAQGASYQSADGAWYASFKVGLLLSAADADFNIHISGFESTNLANFYQNGVANNGAVGPLYTGMTTVMVFSGTSALRVFSQVTQDTFWINIDGIKCQTQPTF